LQLDVKKYERIVHMQFTRLRQQACTHLALLAKLVTGSLPRVCVLARAFAFLIRLKTKLSAVFVQAASSRWWR